MIPCNRHLLIEPIAHSSEDDEESSILLPEDYVKSRTEEEEYSLYRVKAVARDVPFDPVPTFKPGIQVLVQNSMVQEIKTKQTIYHFVLINYVLAVIDPSIIDVELF